MNFANEHLPNWAALAVNTVLVIMFVAHIIYHDMPLKKIFK